MTLDPKLSARRRTSQRAVRSVLATTLAMTVLAALHGAPGRSTDEQLQAVYTRAGVGSGSATKNLHGPDTGSPRSNEQAKLVQWTGKPAPDGQGPNHNGATNNGEKVEDKAVDKPANEPSAPTSDPAGSKAPSPTPNISPPGSSTSRPGSTTTAPPATGGPAPTGMLGIRVDPSALPSARPGFTSHRIGPATHQPNRSDGVGAFRINCYLSHMNFDDPIVAPGRVGASHLHQFFGNDRVDANTTARSLATSGGSTCTGGTANRSGYWTPAMVDTRTGRPVLPWHQADDPWQANNASTVYYKTGYQGVPAPAVTNPPTGLRIIAGSASRTALGATGPESPRYWCNIKGGFAPYDNGFDLDRNCRPGDLLVMTVGFPQCWNGRDLDSPDHQSHMAYGRWGPVPGQNGAGCPASHPVPIPEVTINVNFEVPAGGTSSWRLASDMYDGPGGYSGHADWWNGWDRDVFQQVVDNCYRPGLDCQMNLLGNGRALN